MFWSTVCLLLPDTSSGGENTHIIKNMQRFTERHASTYYTIRLRQKHDMLGEKIRLRTTLNKFLQSWYAVEVHDHLVVK